MKHFLPVFSLFVLTSIAVFGQKSETRSVGPFSGIKASEGIDVFIKKGSKESVRVEATGTDLNNIITEVSGSYLRVHMRSGDHGGKINAKVYVTYVKVDKISASSAGSVFGEDTLEADEIELSSSSAGTIEINVHGQEVDATVSSAGQIEVQGKTNKFRVNASSAGQIDAYDLDAQQVIAEASGAGSIKLSVRDDLDANASSGGSIRYHGNPNNSNTNSSSGGSVKKSN
jgi:Putative auto-transporter adhesin, head GIN domain